MKALLLVLILDMVAVMLVLSDRYAGNAPDAVSSPIEAASTESWP